MKRSGIFWGLQVLLACCIFMMTGCFGSFPVIYADPENYTSGDTEISDRVEALDIDWQSGRVDLVTHNGGGVIVTEKDGNALAVEHRVHWWLDGTTLRIRFCASGERITFFEQDKKELTVSLPDDLMLSDLKIVSVSASVAAARMKAGEINITTASGEIDLSCEAEEISLNSASGKIELEQKGHSESISANSASGKINLGFESAEKADLETASGEISVSAVKVDGISVKTVSGGISLSFDETPEACKARSVSESIGMVLPESKGFAVQFNTVSGEFFSDFALKKDGNRYIFGDGNADIKIDTTSGGVNIRTK